MILFFKKKFAVLLYNLIFPTSDDDDQVPRSITCKSYPTLFGGIFKHFLEMMAFVIHAHQHLLGDWRRHHLDCIILVDRHTFYTL